MTNLIHTGDQSGQFMGIARHLKSPSGLGRDSFFCQKNQFNTPRKQATRSFLFSEFPSSHTTKKKEYFLSCPQFDLTQPMMLNRQLALGCLLSFTIRLPSLPLSKKERRQKMKKSFNSVKKYFMLRNGAHVLAYFTTII